MPGGGDVRRRARDVECARRVGDGDGGKDVVEDDGVCVFRWASREERRESVLDVCVMGLWGRAKRVDGVYGGNGSF